MSALPLGGSAAPPAAAAAKTPSDAPAPAPGSWVDSLQDYLPALRSCTFEAMRTEAVVWLPSATGR